MQKTADGMVMNWVTAWELRAETQARVAAQHRHSNSWQRCRLLSKHRAPLQLFIADKRFKGCAILGNG